MNRTVDVFLKSCIALLDRRTVEKSHFGGFGDEEEGEEDEDDGGEAKKAKAKPARAKKAAEPKAKAPAKKRAAKKVWLALHPTQVLR